MLRTVSSPFRLVFQTQAFRSLGLLAVIVLGQGCMGCLQRAMSTAIPLDFVGFSPPDLPAVVISDVERFSQNLQRSPYWYVTQDRDGNIEAQLRVATDGWPRYNGRFVSEDITGQPLQRITNRGLADEQLVSLTARVVFGTPKSPFDNVASGLLRINVHSVLNRQIDGNAFSRLVVPLNDSENLFLVVREQGADPSRAQTLAKLPHLMKEVARVASLPAEHRVDQEYSAFLAAYPETPLGRLKGTQDRDAFYGMLRARPGVTYSPINIRVSHPVFCNGECTRDGSRRRKAELVGDAIPDSDVVYFLIEDNAVYLAAQEHIQRFGIFSGSESFDGTIEVLNGAEEALHSDVGPFRGWER
jgi:hypothetical protein